MLDWISANAVTTQEEAFAYLRREVPGADLEQVVQAVNAAADALEIMTGRRLAFRTYRDSVTAQLTAVANSATLSGTSVSDSVKVGDDVSSGDAPRFGSRVVAVSSIQAILDRPCETAALETMTFGSEPEIHDWPSTDFWGNEGPTILYAREFPIVEIFAIKEVDGEGNTTDLDIANIRIDREAGAIFLDARPSRGTLNVELHYSAGLRFPSETYRGDREAFVAQRACHRLASINFQDWKNAPGRRVDVTLGTMSSRIEGFGLPPDIQSDVDILRRR